MEGLTGVLGVMIPLSAIVLGIVDSWVRVALNPYAGARLK